LPTIWRVEIYIISASDSLFFVFVSRGGVMLEPATALVGDDDGPTVAHSSSVTDNPAVEPMANEIDQPAFNYSTERNMETMFNNIPGTDVSATAFEQATQWARDISR
jgi:hypothetical protein